MSDERQVVVKSLKIVGLGSALAHVDGETWMVSGALPGESVEVVAHTHHRGVVEARTQRVFADPHPARASLPCPDAGPCGGCDWPHVDIDRGVGLKADVAAEAARMFPELSERLRSAPIQPSPNCYRLRCRLHWDSTTRSLGFYATGSNAVFPITRCTIISKRLSKALPLMTQALSGCCPEPVDVEWLEDLQGDTSVAALRPAKRGVPIRDIWVPRRTTLEPMVYGFHFMESNGRIRKVWGKTNVWMKLPVPLEVPIGAFFQVNRHLVPWLFDRFSSLAGDRPVPTWDLHAGVGFLAAAALHAAARDLVAVEPYAPSAAAARTNLPTATVHVGRTAERYLESAGDLPRECLVMIDPPRTGLSRELRGRLASWKPARILGLACDPSTWARDTAELLEHGYTLTHIELIDLFPSTHHVELLYLLEQR